MYDLMKRLIKVPSVSGKERLVGEIIKNEIAENVDNIYFDTLGNLIAFKKGTAENAKKLMFAGHMDEIGFMAMHIEDNGFIRVAQIGGVNWGAVAYGNILFDNGIKGVLIPEANVSANDWNANKVVIDIGAIDKKDAEKKIKIGDTAVYEPRMNRLMHRRVSGHPMDDKIGCAVMIKALLASDNVANDTYFVFTVQEEVGCRGSKTSAFGIMPDWAIAFDVTGTGDTQGAKPMAIKLGNGAAIKIKDASVICDNAAVDLLKRLAKENKIKHQLEILESGGTDTSSMQVNGSGALSCCISIPTRYIHSGVETIDLADADSCVALTVALLGYDLNTINK
ncbi:MAG: M42 family metallopeptidase [Eubacteriales bacterium]